MMKPNNEDPGPDPECPAASGEDVIDDDDNESTAGGSGEEGQRSFSPRRFLDFEHKRPAYLFVFLFLLPVLWAIFIGIGWTMDDKVEDQVANIWTRQKSSYAKDMDYAAKYDRDTLGATSFAAMAISRDGENLFTKERLEEIRARMEETESTTIKYKGITYTWDDICSSNDAGLGTSYKFPCARLSPMDFFQEARWFMDEEDRVTWYQEVVRKLVIAPRLPRFGIMQFSCSNLINPLGRADCNNVILHRLFQGKPMLLLADIGNLENNDLCKQCIEEEFEDTMTQNHHRTQLMFEGLYDLTSKSGQTKLAEQYANILKKLNRQAVIDFWSYYVTRGLYVSLGESAYMESRDRYNVAISGCTNPGSTTPCPPLTTKQEARDALANHADHAFSSTVTSGNPLPVWGEDGEGYLLQGTSPVSGSGVDMSGSMFSTLGYLAAPNAANWEDMVASDPVYAWFIASETPMIGHCGNGFLKGTSGMGAAIDAVTGAMMTAATQQWCTKYNEPFEDDDVRTIQHFARMWYDLLVDSPNFLGLVQGESDPYVWTTGQGCGYELGGSRYPYTDSASTEELMGNASGELYYIDEGESVGAIDRNLLMGGRNPRDYDVGTPLREVSVIQSIYPALLPEDIVQRVKNCNRPDGSVDISLDDAEEILYRFKEKIEDTWTRGWDDDSAGNVSFVGFFDDSGVVGTTGRMLKDITLSNGDLVAISMAIIALFSVLFVLSIDPVESRIMITVLGVFLVIFAFFAAVGFGLIVRIKINITIAWTLPFILLGLGVDDMYMVLLALRKQKGYTMEDFLAAMQEVAVPITMTSVVNAGMFALMNISDVPAVYLTAQVALISVIFLYGTIMLCFTAWGYLDMRRQGDNRYDIFFCFKSRVEHREKSKMWASFFYDRIYQPLLLNPGNHIVVWSHLLVWLIAATLLGLGIWGLTEDQRAVGLGLEDFFPEDNQASRWATMRTEELASWSIQMNWGAVNYSDPTNQMSVIKQFEAVVLTPHVAERDTKSLWLADFAVWTTYQCRENFDRDDPEVLECGINQVYPVDNTTCTGTWTPNSLGLRDKQFADIDTCIVFEGGVCRPRNQMHPHDLALIDDEEDRDKAVDSWCPVIEGWTDDKMRFCLGKWRELTGGDGRLVLMNETGTPTECEGEFYDDETVKLPIPYSVGPTMFAFDLFTHEITIDMVKETRAICDDDPDIHCWLSGIPYDYWSQYIKIFGTFWEIGAISVGTGFGISFLFLVGRLLSERRHALGKVLVGSFLGSILIAVTTILSLVCVSGLSALFDVSFTGFSVMSFVLSVGFAVEYSVHIVARWLLADTSFKTSLERVEHAMEFLFLPTFMSFVSSTIGVACLAFTEFEFNEVFFFRPLIIVMLVTYFFGCWWLPVLLVLLDFDTVKFGHGGERSERVEPRDEASLAAKEKPEAVSTSMKDVDEEEEEHEEEEAS